MFDKINYNGPLCQWIKKIRNIENGEEVRYFGEYYFKVRERLYYIDLRCRKGDFPSKAFCRMFTHLKTGELFYEDILKNIPDIENRGYSTQEFRSICEQFATSSVMKYEERIKDLEKGRSLIDNEDWDKMNIKNFETEADFEPWSMVDECGRKFKNERFLITGQTCAKCGSPVVKSKFCSSPESWENLAGREGWLWFCPKCKEQLQERVTVMN